MPLSSDARVAASLNGHILLHVVDSVRISGRYKYVIKEIF